MIMLKDMDTHIRVCEGRVECPECHNYVLDSNFSRHLSHSHGLEQCKYCNEIVQHDAHQEHLDFDCSYQPTQCDYCDNVYRGDEEMEHLCSHLQEVQKEDIDLLMKSHDLRKRTQEIRDRISRL
jgi:hypothetical protein